MPTNPDRLTADMTQRQVFAIASTPLVPYSDRRRSLVISGDGVSSVILHLRRDIDATSAGIVLTATNPVLHLDYDRHGEAVHGPWFAKGGTGNSVVVFLETLSTAP